MSVGLAAVAAAIWIYLLCARGSFWRTRQALPQVVTHSIPMATVVAVIPARDEAAVIGPAVESLLQQTLRPVCVIVVDDGSDDGTAEVASAAARACGAADRVRVIRGTALPPGWTGKLWAMSQGIAAAATHDPGFLLLTDADVHHEPSHLARLVALAHASGADLTTCMVRLTTRTFAERCLIPAFVFFFFMLYPPAWVARQSSRAAAAAGGCMLVRPQALARIGGVAAIRGELIDDCALARAIKQSGGRLWLGLTRDARSLRGYGSFAALGGMISRSAFNQLNHSFALLLAALCGLGVTFLAPPLLLFSSEAKVIALGAFTWLLMTACYMPMARFYGMSPVGVLSLPLVAAFYGGATVHSAVQFARGRGGRWKGRTQDGRSRQA